MAVFTVEALCVPVKAQVATRLWLLFIRGGCYSFVVVVHLAWVRL